HFSQVNAGNGQVPGRRKSLNDSLEGDVRDFLVNESELHTYDDLTKVNPVTPTTVLKCLQARYSARVFYTHAGCTLVALNPFQPIPHLYSLDMMREYHSAPQPQEFKPHIFIVAEEAYRNVQGQVEPVNQSLVVSGESGAGKTWTSRCLMKYYATVAVSSQKCQDTVERIERRVLDSNPVMEAFGEGKRCDLGRKTELLVGASVQTYLLEKTRVAFQAPDERNFHIFYQMRKGATEKQRQEWEMPHDQKFTWLPNADKTLEGLYLYLYYVKWSKMKTASLLQVPAEELQECVTVRALRAGKQNVLLKPCSQSECIIRRDCLAKVIYAQLFEWLVTFINNSMCSDNSKWSNFIGLLDVYGFECFLLNNLEQLCINYANEKLQQHFVAHYLKAQQEEYVTEGLKWSFVSYQDNQSCLDLIEGSPTSIFSLLNEECRLNRASDAKQFRVRLEKELSGNNRMSWDKFSKQPHFIVAHYAGNVSYQIEGMMEKNKDPVPPELLSLLQKSEDPLLQSLFAASDTEGNSSRPHSKVVTVVSKFKNSLECLMKILHSTTPHYTRCIKPNPDCRPLTFRKEEVITQLEACGIVETIHISAAGFPIRGPNILINGISVLLLPFLQSKICVILKARCLVGPGTFFQGFPGGCPIYFHHTLVTCVCYLYFSVFSVVRAWLVRREVRSWHKAASVIQARWRSWRSQMDALADAELDDAEDLQEEEEICSLSSIPEPVTVRSWPLGLAMAHAPNITVAFTATGFQKVMSLMATLKIPFRHGEYKVETNQFDQGVASIRAQPRGSVKLHMRRSPLRYADMHPGSDPDGVTGLNQILLDSV
uniref:Myosin XIX n=1 Tax=Astyanax mexicanus TaxID=7994 RepID=A0A8B9RP66_ASTMX